MSPRTILLVGAPSFDIVQSTFRRQEDTLESRKALDTYTVITTGITADLSNADSDSATAPFSGDEQQKVELSLDPQRLEPFRIDGDIGVPSMDSGPEWRLLPIAANDLSTSLTERGWLAWTPLEWAQHSAEWKSAGAATTQEHTTSSTSFDTEFDDESLHTGVHIEDCEEDFLEKSFALHEITTDSPVTPILSFGRDTGVVNPPFTPITESSDEESHALPSSPLAPKSRNCGQFSNLPSSLPKQNIKVPAVFPAVLADLPTANEILQARPSTLTVNLIVGVLALKPIRMVNIKRTGRAAGLLEVVVADHTATSGFGISFWIDPLEAHNNQADLISPKHDLRIELTALEVGDVILITNLALSQWKERVHGSSLARRAWRTEIKLLWRRISGWSSLGKELLSDPFQRQQRGKSWTEHMSLVRSWAASSIAPDSGARRPSSEANAATPRLSKRKFLPDDDSFEF